MILYPSARLVYFINEQQIARHGGSFTPPYNLRIDGAIDLFLETIQVKVFGTDPFPTLYNKATALAWKIIAEHPFHDGNKRTGMAAAMTFMRLNERKVIATEDELVDVAMQVAMSYETGFSEEDLELWLYRHT